MRNLFDLINWPHTNCRAHDERLNFEFCVFTANEDPLFYSPKSTYLAVVAIDFGTTYSGFAFSFIKDQGRDAIFMNMDWVNEQGGQTSKTPTCLLLKPDLSFDSFGYEAIEKYAGLEGEGEEREYLFFKHFKMALHSDEVCLLAHFYMYIYGYTSSSISCCAPTGSSQYYLSAISLRFLISVVVPLDHVLHSERLHLNCLSRV